MLLLLTISTKTSQLLYLSQVPQLLASMRMAVTQGDATALQQAAHSLKSSSSQVGAQQLADLCRQLERLGQRGCLPSAAPLLTAGDATHGLLQPALAAVLQGSSEVGAVEIPRVPS